MLCSLKLTNFRGFRDYTLDNLGRVNLIVGTNNSGKTSVLEAVHLLKANADPWALWSVFSRHREMLPNSTGEIVAAFDIRSLFHGHDISLNATFSITSRTTEGVLSLFANFENDGSPGQRHELRQQAPFDNEDSSIRSDCLQPLRVIFRWSPSDGVNWACCVTQHGRVFEKWFRESARLRWRTATAVRSILSTGLPSNVAATRFDALALTSGEDLAMNAIHLIDPSIERIAVVGNSRSPGDLGGIMLKLKGINNPIPVSAMGDGVSRLLGIALTLVQCENGILLIDDIDTGLHHSVMEKMWKLVYETAKRLNIQVFATTHSRDCYESLASVCREHDLKHSDVTIQRMERSKSQSVAYSEEEIKAAAEFQIEVR